ncbi:MAG TPA: hypothetical protein VE242_03260 [Chthoniobacterales bacterium]|nr:hypothetical protein [Chthoniobacterales bacterium]
MFLVFPQSIIIPEILEHLEDTDFEDWLTATLIESANQQLSRNGGSNGAHSSPGGIADLWMLEVAERDGNVWKGKFQVEFIEENGESSEDARLTGQEPGEVLFALNTKNAEITFKPASTARAET